MKRILVAVVLGLSLTSCSSASTSSGTTSSADPTKLIKQFVMSINTSAACSSGGFAACMNWRLSLAYPGSMDQVEAKKCIAARADDPDYKYILILADSTLQEDPEWVGPEADTPDWIFAGKKPEGKTYKADLTIAENYSGTDSTVVWDTHFTIKDGKVYWFPRIC